MPVLGCATLGEYIERYQVDAVLWKADRLLGNLDNMILRNDRCMEVAKMLSVIPESNSVMRDDYIKKICSKHDIKQKTLEKMISDFATREKKATNKKVRKNLVKALDADPKTFPFFKEMIKENAKTGERFLERVQIDKERFVALLSSFGFTRYETGTDSNEENYNTVRVDGNVITTFTRNKIIDHLEDFIKTEYDFEGAKCEFVDSRQLIKSFYDQIRTVFSKDIFARVRLEHPIIINTDTSTVTYLYFKNGFIEISKNGYQLLSYTQMPGSVWDHQLKGRDFAKIEDPIEQLPEAAAAAAADPAAPAVQEYKSVFVDFVWKICGQREERFKSLCCIIGYIVHDFYSYNLKMIYFTDSTISDSSEGRTGKTLLMKMIGEVRSYCEIHGKNFDPHNEKRYETVKLGTQIVHVNDVSSKGKNRFEVEPMFNDITEGLHVRAMYMAPFRQFVKMVASGNKSLYISGDSSAARIMEFELSNFFSLKNRPDEFYGQWFGRDWDPDEWNLFDNFICLCAQMFHLHGLQEPPAINLMERKLRDHTALEFIEFMEEIKVSLKKFGVPWSGYMVENNMTALSYEMQDYIFDRKKLFERFINEYEDFKKSKFFTVRKFNTWLYQFSAVRLKINRPTEWKSNGCAWIQFKEAV